jgi:DNA mismatch endonuclease (patch repair protein)
VTDVLTPEQRSRCMAAIRSRDTKPEILVRRILTSLGYRYRLHGKTLPGRPDIVLARRRKVIFVHGCFWHRHRCRYGSVQPKTNAKFWEKKLLGNVQRDRINHDRLRQEKWQYLIIWECETGNPDRLLNKLIRFLEAS